MVFETPSRRRSPVPIIVASAIGLVAIIATYLILSGGGGGGGDGKKAGSRKGCVSVTIAASSEKAALLGDLAGGYAKADRRFAGKCGDVHIVSKASGAAMEALATGWDAARDGGPAPQVWSPASSSWISLLRQRATEADKPVVVATGELPKLAQTPLVLAMPKPMAQALGWPDKAIGWSDVLGLTKDPQGWGKVGHPEWGGFKLGKTNPRYSTSGLHATIGAYVAATGRASDLTETDLADPQVLEFTKGVESGVVHYGDTTLTFLSNLAEADAKGQGTNYVSAVAVEEKSVYDYNQGNPTGDPKLAGKGRKPKTPLVAVYPKEGTLLSDNPYAVLTTASDDQRAAANDFLAYVRQPQQQKRFTDAAFRSYDGKADGPLTEANGLLANAKYQVLGTPSSAVMAKALATWDTQRKRARVLLVLDVSGSMGDATDTGSTKLELAKQAVLKSLDLFAPDDEVGFWTFSSEQRGASTPYTEQVPVGALNSTKARISSVVGSLAPNGATALYTTARAAQRTLSQSADPQRINAVVLLTDGRNEYRDNDLDGLLRDIDASKLENPVRLFTIAYGSESDWDTLQKIAKTTRAAAYDARDPASIDKVLVNVISNF